MEGEISKLKNEELSILNTKLKNQKQEIENQNIHLEHALNELKKTQTQLIHAEKMASLGQLTAGIAHEIQNPLNFVNNFSELNKELIQELKDEIIKGNNENAMGISMDIEANAIKINHHGQRASSIVKNMLEHSRTSTGKKELTDINGLAEECLKLAYHAFLSGRQGWRAKDSHDEMHQTFHVDLVTDLDTSIPLLNINKQDLGRALLNIFNNAFQAVSENHSLSDHAASPGVQLVTKMEGDKIQVSVLDNGPGIPDSIKEKIFQPFFTTKPTGQGTGLGLSLAYDIVKAHGGTILLDSTVGKGSTFVITIPVI
jgi:signal transduction histidine kinase